MRLIFLILLIRSCICQGDDPSRDTRAIDGSDTEATADDQKFKIYVGTINGVRRELFNEVEGGQKNVLPDSGDRVFDPFGAYDDNNIVATENEKSLFVPKPYRPESKKPQTKPTTPRTTTRPPTTIRTIPFVQTTPAPVFRPQQPFRPNVQQPIQPQRPFIPQSNFNQPQTLPSQPQQPFRPQLPQSQLPQQPVQPFAPQFTRPFLGQSQPQQPQAAVAPFLPSQPSPQLPQQSRPASATAQVSQPRLPFANTNNLRSGQCRSSVFYISTPISGPTRLTFTHFAIAVTVDQCARTCHEFNCAIAHYNPINGHCEFNPSTAFAIRNGQCPAWPSLHYRNNVVASEPVRIFCVTCQRPRRRPGKARSLRNRSKAHASARHARSKKPSSSHPIIHGVLVKQPQAVTLSLTQNQFTNEGEEAIEPQLEIPVSVSETETEDSITETNDDGDTRENYLKNKSESRLKQLSLLHELEDLST